MTGSRFQTYRAARIPSWLATLAVTSIYLAILVASNSNFTMLDDECDSMAIAGRPVAAALRPALMGQGYGEAHPPESAVLWHLWLRVTDYSFAWIRILANLLYVGAVLLAAKSAENLAGRRAYGITLASGFLWPFAFQYGRIAGWYCLSTFLLSLVTWLYLLVIEGRSKWRWSWFALACVLLVWSNYFGFVFLVLLLLDLLLFHRDLARRHAAALVIVAGVIAATSLPLLRIAPGDVTVAMSPAAQFFDWKYEIAAVGSSAFALFGSAAIAPWYLPLSVPIALGVIALLVSTWFSPSRRWLVYVAAAFVGMDLLGVLGIKRILIFMPWLLLTLGVAAAEGASRSGKTVRDAIAVIVAIGWVGIVWGKHYATTNLYEPWSKVAEVVAGDARRGATIVSANSPFFFYLDYALRLQSDTETADGAFLGESLYRAHGYRIQLPEVDHPLTGSFRGPVVLVEGTSLFEDVAAMKQLRAYLDRRCATVGEFRAAPDPAMAWKERFAAGVPILDYRTDVVWFNCPASN